MITRTWRLGGVLIGALIFIFAVNCVSVLGAEKITLKLMSHRYAALEFFAEALEKNAPPNVKIESELMPYSKWLEKMRVNLAAGSSAYDITYIDPKVVQEFASKGWLVPLSEYIEKYENKFHFSDIPQSNWNNHSYRGKIYSIPHHQLSYIMFYRQDLLSQAGLEPPEDIEDYIEKAAKLTTPNRYGTSLTLEVPDSMSNEFHNYLRGCGGAWFDKNYKSTFNELPGILAVHCIRRLLKYAPPGVMNYGNDESMVAMQHDKVAMMLQWSTRAPGMRNPEESKVVGLVKYDQPPSYWQGGPAAGQPAASGYAISAFTKNDPELIFQIIARATDEETARKAHKVAMPVRLAVATDPQLVEQHPEWEAVVKNVEAGGVCRPVIAEYTMIMEISTRRIAQALVGEMEIKEALDLAVEESREVFKESGRYE